MKRVLKTAGVILGLCLSLGVIVSKVEKSHGLKGWADGHMPYGFYEREVKRPLDFGLSLFGIILLWPVMLAAAALVNIKLGKPVLFKQKRPGLDGRVFTIRKYRTMLDGDAPDGERLTDFGRKLRSTSIDELPELFNIIRGDMSLVGPRPQLVRDMVFMSGEYKKRHSVLPGLTGLAQVSGRNMLTWEDKFAADLKYIKKISFAGDLKIVLQTIKKVLLRAGINESGQATALDYGDWLYVTGKVSLEEYIKKQEEAEGILNEDLQ